MLLEGGGGQRHLLMFVVVWRVSCVCLECLECVCVFLEVSGGCLGESGMSGRCLRVSGRVWRLSGGVWNVWGSLRDVCGVSKICLTNPTNPANQVNPESFDNLSQLYQSC